MALNTVRIDNRYQAKLLQAPGPVRKDLVELFGWSFAAVAGIPSRGVEQRKINRSKGPCRLLRECVRHIADFPIGGPDRPMHGAPGGVGRPDGHRQESDDY